MPISFLSYYSTGPNTNAATTFIAIGGASDASTTETDIQNLMRTGGTFSGMQTVIAANAKASTVITFRKNAGAATNETFTIGASATGFFRDSTHTDVIVAGDLIDSQWPFVSSSSITPDGMSINFTPTDGITTMSRPGTGINLTSFSTASTSRFRGPSGFCNGAWTATESICKCRVRKVVTVQNCRVNVKSNSRTTTNTWASRIGGVTKNISVTWTTGTGSQEDTTHTDVLAAGNDYNWDFTTGTGAQAITIYTVSADWTNTNGDFFMTAGPPTIVNTVNANTTVWEGLGGDLDPSTTAETGAQYTIGGIFTFNNANVILTANTVSATSFLTLRAGAANVGSISVSITASTPGEYFDSTHTYVSAAADKMNYQVVAGATGTAMTFGQMAIWANSPSAAVVVANPRFFTTKTDLRQLNPAFSNAPILMST